VLAIKVKGDVNLAPLAGEETVMADAGKLIPRRAKVAKRRVFINMPRVMGEHASITRDCVFHRISI
jgi:hypothetical protein